MKKFFRILSTLGFKYSSRVIAKNLLSYNHYYVLDAHLNEVHCDLPNRLSLSKKKLDEDGINQVLENAGELSDADRKEILVRWLFHQSGFKNCYLFQTQDGEPAYLQWIIYPEENNVIRSRYGNRFYPLNKQQVMVENAFVFPKFRGYGLIYHGTLELLKMAQEQNYKYAVTYIVKDNVASINAFVKMGFSLRKIVPEIKFAGITKRFL